MPVIEYPHRCVAAGPVAARMAIRAKPRRLQRGVGLIEVLISVLILGIGLLGIAAMQATALRNSQGSFERSQAVILSYSILDAMRANRAAAVNGDYALGGGNMICTVPTSADSLAAADMQRWIASLKQTLGHPDDTTTCGQVVCVGIGQCTVTVQWDDSRATRNDGDDGRTGSAERREQTITII